ncbi:MAG: dTDP-4-dehydrorhamnose 3,5-epimerase [Phycisphaerae bacterium]
MQIIESDIPDVKILIPKQFGDARGFFSETYSRKTFAEHGIDMTFVQENHSLSVEKGVLRGLHYQIHPHAQDKLVRVVRGTILDVAVDIRRDSPTFGRHVKDVLSAENWRQLLVPVGFAHGFVTLEANTEVLYKVTNFYAPDHERGLRWNDPALDIDWSIPDDQVIMKDRDRDFPRLAEAVDLF